MRWWRLGIRIAQSPYRHRCGFIKSGRGADQSGRLRLRQHLQSQDSAMQLLEQRSGRRRGAITRLANGIANRLILRMPHHPSSQSLQRGHRADPLIIRIVSAQSTRAACSAPCTRHEWSLTTGHSIVRAADPSPILGRGILWPASSSRRILSRLAASECQPTRVRADRIEAQLEKPA
jgi:hypothetical protein